MSGPQERPAWDRLDGALVRLRRCRTATELLERAGELALHGCGADAVVLGRVTDGTWVPWLRSGEAAPLGSDDFVPAGPEPLADAWPVEERVLGSGRTAVRDLPGEAATRHVVIAALTTGGALTGGSGTALGLLHVAGADLRVEIVDAYAQALGSMFGLLGVRRRAEEQRYTLARLRHGLADSRDRPIELYDTADRRDARLGPAPASVSTSALRARLTARQCEVVDLMTVGLSNAEIAERLVVALPTVKSHVRAILRVSGAVNRADAVARFARSGKTS